MVREVVTLLVLSKGQIHHSGGLDLTGSPDLVLLPENVANINGAVAGSAFDTAIAGLARELNTNIIAGITESEDEGFRNASVLWGPDGHRLGRYEKHHRVPFGEYIPWRGLFERLSEDTRFIPRDAIAGTGPAVLAPEGTPRLGIVISYEVFFASRVADAVGRGGQLLLAPTNASSFITDEVPAIEVAASRIRAREFGRSVIQAAPTGYSAIIHPDGAVSEISGLGTSELLTATVPLHDEMTTYARLGDTPMLVVALLILLTPVGHRVFNARGKRAKSRTVSS